mmetsp:Transcript_7342/g.26748  ORF Transcript_7342/g.26748 Transcript_7342/m.26748 type:complete len:251 (+) Transcript_7342:1220-1972(+)
MQQRHLADTHRPCVSTCRSQAPSETEAQRAPLVRKSESRASRKTSLCRSLPSVGRASSSRCLVVPRRGCARRRAQTPISILPRRFAQSIRRSARPRLGRDAQAKASAEKPPHAHLEQIRLLLSRLSLTAPRHSSDPASVEQHNILVSLGASLRARPAFGLCTNEQPCPSATRQLKPRSCSKALSQTIPAIVRHGCWQIASLPLQRALQHEEAPHHPLPVLLWQRHLPCASQVPCQFPLEEAVDQTIPWQE